MGFADVAAGLDLGGCLCGARLCVAAAEAGHEGGLCGACFDHVVAAGRHCEGLVWLGVWMG